MHRHYNSDLFPHSIQPVQEVDFPALTLCPTQADTGEWTRAVLNNLEYDENLTRLFDSFLAAEVRGEVSYIWAWAK